MTKHVGFAYSIALADPHGLDAARYRVALVVDRQDGEQLTEDELEALRAALAPFRAETAKPARAPKATAKTKRAQPASKTSAARTARAR